MVEWFKQLPLYWQIIIIIGCPCFAFVCAGLTDLVNPDFAE